MSQTTEILDGRYRLGRMLGQGGMSDVYEAIDEQSGAAVAVKIVRAGDPELGRRVAQEARALERLDNPGLVRLLHAGLVGSQAYLVMELVSGSTLDRELRRGPLGPDRTAVLGARLAGALAYVHQQGIVHRDVKPSNILLTPDGEALLGDFGIARLLDASTLTIAGSTLGTAAYMAPEQLEDHQVGPQADIWSLGMVLLECLTGRRIYEGSASEVVAKRFAGPVPLPPDLSVPWRLLVTGMLDHRPDQRLTGTEVAALLDTSPFHEPWVPSSATEKGAFGPTVPHDLTALAPGPTATAVLVPDSTAVLRGDPIPPSDPVRRRRWWVAAAGAVLAAGLLIGLLLGLGGSPGNAPHRSGVRSTTTTLAPSTTTTTTTTTTTVPSGPSALAALVRDVAAGEAAGSIDQGSAQGISGQAQQAVSDAAASKGSQAANDLQQAAMTIADGVHKGKITQPEGTALQADLDALAAALGLSAAAVAPPSH